MEIINTEFNILLPASTDLAQQNDEFSRKHHNSVEHVQASLKVRRLLDPSSDEKNQQDLIRTLALEDRSLQTAIRGLELLVEWKAKSQYLDDYIAAARERWPEASAFEEKLN